MATGQERRQDFQLHTQEGQDFSAAAAAAHLITYKSSESRSVDLANNGMGNHYLRHVDHGSHCLTLHRTASFGYMSDWTSEGAELRRYVWVSMRRKEKPRIRTATKFAVSSAGHSESAFCSSVTKVAAFMLLQTSHSPLTIAAENLCLSIAGEKHTVASQQRMVTSSCSSSLPPCRRKMFGKVSVRVFSEKILGMGVPNK